ncbi:hypothetical protein [Tychonema sp. LEGE 07203]|nr:hypothetical protein [Tychonema sp. LEGE 07203]MBE9092954.1 hypothetical protein [Tychonema sp. LEGE 07203]
MVDSVQQRCDEVSSIAFVLLSFCGTAVRLHYLSSHHLRSTDNLIF